MFGPHETNLGSATQHAQPAEPHEIAAIVAGYARVARHCAEGGFDGVELQCSQSSIIRGFLSPATNRLTDGSAGHWHRADLLGRGLGPRGHRPGARARPATCWTRCSRRHHARRGRRGGPARRRHRAVDYINITVGVATASLYLVVASMRTGPGYALHVPAAIRAAVGIPVIGAGRITSPQEADQVLAAGQCDLVGVVRGQIADPDFAAKARREDAAAIRTCLSCNQECAGRWAATGWPGCTGNPRAGRNPCRCRRLPALPRTRQPVNTASPVPMGRRPAPGRRAWCGSRTACTPP